MEAVLVDSVQAVPAAKTREAASPHTVAPTGVPTETPLHTCPNFGHLRLPVQKKKNTPALGPVC